jgi:hypothetical protein
VNFDTHIRICTVLYIRRGNVLIAIRRATFEWVYYQPTVAVDLNF